MKTTIFLTLIAFCVMVAGCAQDKVPSASREPQVQYKMVPAQGDPNATK